MHSLELKRTNETGLVDFIDFFLVFLWLRKGFY